MQNELLDKIVQDWPHLKYVCDNAKDAEGTARKGLERQIANNLLGLKAKSLTPLELLEISDSLK
ncbi:hypothetical protein [Paenibacillus xylanexedens]|uniref:hypothetical protein n=1 Tax=Paenibacillus xylanexedens TaxID=528191 RepID=UPI0011A1ECA0|nr:hypothetical protein [Paenibacillus xylanexedens]